MIILIKNFLILISFFSIITTCCLHFEDSSSRENYCIINKAHNFSEISYEECLQCYIKSQPNKIGNQTLSEKCQSGLQCIEFEFYNKTLFEHFFRNYSYLLKDLFQISNSSKIANTLYIKIKHDNFKKLNLGYIQSILKSNGIDYSYLLFALFDQRKQLLLDLETDRSEIPLDGIQIQITCDANTRSIYYTDRYAKFVVHSNNCLIIQLTNLANETISTEATTRNHKPRINLFLFIGGLIIFVIWILCLSLCIYFRYQRWKNHDGSNQRLSIVSSIFSMDSLDSRKDDTLLSKQKSHHLVYSLDRDF